ncbi:hypothetical protein [Janthinobacterium fluminis]|uniref:Haem-binding uptake Tiki superfamily ChaN domain-containing protein n=1 Tax=Janthinobacterium fluminis TaxID=2987524 RepID=A0ABT5K793_9BURK|nr:hypothetical protein [Janthinobacterium fluminis]MDC8760877.1 hypothetical protein [Janthinobacterium fluminis]
MKIVISKTAIALGLLLVVYTGLSHASVPGCGRGIENLERIDFARTRIVVLGEVHGTMQAQDFMQALACHALASRRRVVLGIEAPVAIQAPLSSYVRGAIPQRQFAADSNVFWRGEDGRSSAAMMGLIGHIRRMKAAGANIELFAFDGVAAKRRARQQQEASRDQQMALNVRAKLRQRPGALLLLLVGNIHAAKHKLDPEYAPPMVSYLLDLPILTLGMRYRSGNFWVCYDGCAVHSTQGMPDASRQFGIGDIDKSGEYDRFFDVGHVNASPPYLDSPASR